MTGVLVEEVHQIVALGFVQRFQVLYHLVGLHVGKYLNTLPEPQLVQVDFHVLRVFQHGGQGLSVQHMIELFALGPVQNGEHVGNIVFVIIFNFFFQRLGGDRSPNDGGQFLTVVGMLGRGAVMVVVRMLLVGGVLGRFGRFQVVFFQFILFHLVHVSFLLFRCSTPDGAGRESLTADEKRTQKSHCTEILFPKAVKKEQKPTAFGQWQTRTSRMGSGADQQTAAHPSRRFIVFHALASLMATATVHCLTSRERKRSFFAQLL